MHLPSHIANLNLLAATPAPSPFRTLYTSSTGTSPTNDETALDEGIQQQLYQWINTEFTWAEEGSGNKSTTHAGVQPEQGKGNEVTGKDEEEGGLMDYYKKRVKGGKERNVLLDQKLGNDAPLSKSHAQLQVVPAPTPASTPTTTTTTAANSTTTDGGNTPQGPRQLTDLASFLSEYSALLSSSNPSLDPALDPLNVQERRVDAEHKRQKEIDGGIGKVVHERRETTLTSSATAIDPTHAAHAQVKNQQQDQNLMTALLANQWNYPSHFPNMFHPHNQPAQPQAHAQAHNQSQNQNHANANVLDFDRVFDMETMGFPFDPQPLAVISNSASVSASDGSFDLADRSVVTTSGASETSAESDVALLQQQQQQHQQQARIQLERSFAAFQQSQADSQTFNGGERKRKLSDLTSSNSGLGHTPKRSRAESIFNEQDPDHPDDLSHLGLGLALGGGGVVGAEEDKRRRNTAASARFRMKKKEREQAMEKHAREMEQRVVGMEKEMESLRKENSWLKALVINGAPQPFSVPALGKEDVRALEQEK